MLGDPAVQAGPADDQRLVRDVRLTSPGALIAALRDEPVIGEVLQEFLKLDRVVAGAELFHGLLTTCVRAAFAELDQSQKDPPGDLALRRVHERRNDRLGVTSDRDFQSGLLAPYPA